MGVLLIIIIFIALVVLSIHTSGSYEERNKAWKERQEESQRRAGRIGEKLARNWIARVLRNDDTLLTNVSIEFEGKPAECDNIIVNSYGVFIIEVKNYAGTLYGEESDFEWEKEKTTPAGNTYTKTVKNPIRQVKRQIYILKNFLVYYGVSVWVEGYAFLVEGNSPVESMYILNDLQEIDHVIHTPRRQRLSREKIEKIIELLR